MYTYAKQFYTLWFLFWRALYTLIIKCAFNVCSCAIAERKSSQSGDHNKCKDKNLVSLSCIIKTT